MRLIKNKREEERRKALALTIKGLLSRTDALFGRSPNEREKEARLNFWTGCLIDLQEPLQLVNAFRKRWQSQDRPPRLCEIVGDIPASAFREAGHGFQAKLISGGKHGLD